MITDTSLARTDRTAPEEPRLLSRELSRLDFAARVLALAEDPDVPLLERAKFLAIFSESLDEFFQVRVGDIKDRLEAGSAIGQHGLTAAEEPPACARSCRI